MPPFPPQYYAHIRQAPQFLQSVQKAKLKDHPRPIRQALDAFEDDPFLLYACLWYAASEGVTVTFTPAELSKN